MSSSVSKGPPNPSVINMHSRAIVALTCPESLASSEEMSKMRGFQNNVVKTATFLTYMYSYVCLSDIKGREDWRDPEFVFDYAYGPWVTSEAFYVDLIRPILPILLGGVNCSVFVSEATGSGTSHILYDATNQTRLINATMKDLFGYLERMAGEYEYQLGISYFEVSDDGGQVRDLLNFTGVEVELSVRETSGGVGNICNLSWHRPRDMYHLMEILRKGESRPCHIGSDEMGANPSFHAIFQLQIQLHQRLAMYDSLNVPFRSAKLVMVDLTGCDSTGRNGGLHALGNCLNALAFGSQAIPFRDSTLTMILMDVIGEDCRTVLISKAGVAATPKEWFPIEIWETILSNLDDSSDLNNLSGTCRDLHRIVRKNLDPIRLVYRHIIPYLCKSDILSCRQVSRGLCNGVDKFLANHPYREFQDGRMDIVWRDAWEVTRVFRNGNFDLDRSPFVGRTLYFTDASGNESGIEILRNGQVNAHIFHVRLNSRGGCEQQSWSSLLRFMKLIPMYCKNIKSIRVERGACIEIEEGTYKRIHEEFVKMYGYRWEDYDYFAPELDPISIEFAAQHTDGHCVSYNAFKRILFNEFHSRLVKFEIFTGFPDMLMPSYKCHHVSTLKLVGGSYDSLVELVERVEAPLLKELILAGTYPFTYAEVTHFHDWIMGQDGELLPNINIGRLGKALIKFPRLGVLKLVSIGKKSNWVELEGGDRPIVGNACEDNQNLGERDQRDEKMKMWWLLPPNVMEVQVDWIYYLICDAGNNRPYYWRRRTICEDCPPKTLKSKVFKRQQAPSMY